MFFLNSSLSFSGQCPKNLYTYRADITAVYDGDTVTANIDLGFYTWVHGERLRLFGINAPEVRGRQKIQGKISRDWLRSKILGKNILIQTIQSNKGKDKKGKYGRYLAILFLEEKNGCLNLNDELAKQGLAVYKKY